LAWDMESTPYNALSMGLALPFSVVQLQRAVLGGRRPAQIAASVPVARANGLRKEGRPPEWRSPGRLTPQFSGVDMIVCMIAPEYLKDSVVSSRQRFFWSSAQASAASLIWARTASSSSVRSPSYL